MAVDIARDHFTSLSSVITRTQVDPELVYSSQTDEGTAFYVFNDKQEVNGGFVIVGGDEITRSIIGFSESGHFDPNNIPENLRWWLSQYSEEFRAAKKYGVKTTSSTASLTRSSSGRHTIQPMIQTKWDQKEPFYNAIPTIGNGKFLTGCVATAMSQVMYYHKNPVGNGIGDYNYTINYNTGNGIIPVTFSANYAETSYDWDNMLPVYKNVSYNEVQANAVATLMYHAGVSVNMSYNGNESGASSTKIPGALIDHFGYDKSAYEAQRKYYSDEEWEDLIFGELEEGRPVLYGGQDYLGGGGHEFICDGYDADTKLYSFQSDHTFLLQNQTVLI